MSERSDKVVQDMAKLDALCRRVSLAHATKVVGKIGSSSRLCKVAPVKATLVKTRPSEMSAGMVRTTLMAKATKKVS